MKLTFAGLREPLPAPVIFSISALRCNEIGMNAWMNA